MKTFFMKNMAIVIGLAMAISLSACARSPVSTDFLKEDAEKIDARVDRALSQLYAQHPNLEELSKKAAGVLVIPLVTEAGLFWGGPTVVERCACTGSPKIIIRPPLPVMVSR
ncbi:MAG: hypothetical protein ACO2ZX_09995 [Paracoccaceae bacterium]